MILLVFDEDLLPVVRAIAPAGATITSRIEEAQGAYAFGCAEGADAAASMLLTRPGVLAGAVLLRPGHIEAPDPLPDLTGIPVLVVPGRAGSHEAPQLLAKAGAAVDLAVQDADEFLVPADFALAKKWLSQFAG